jgi:uncharacterized protein YjiS (DUF1127 family)
LRDEWQSRIVRPQAATKRLRRTEGLRMTVITHERFRPGSRCAEGSGSRAAEKGRRRPALSALASAALFVVETLLAWQERVRQRRHLSGLDDRLLKDIGLSRADVQREVEKPFWER